MNNFFNDFDFFNNINLMRSFLNEPSIKERPINLYIGERPRHNDNEPMYVGEHKAENTDYVTELQNALSRQIEETNRINKLYTDAIKKISYLENENNSFKEQLNEYYKIKELLQNVGVQLSTARNEE